MIDELTDEQQEKSISEIISRNRCDRCIAMACYMTVFDSGDLYFCSHHFLEHEEVIRENAYYVIDESTEISASAD
jgi:hypothetical protein